ncbi:bis(5'-adenosyl)-triphosphatase ENPP4-like isoform X2 [Aphidius gifuensis]|uniref:bis(5'-adenosyl)-triphosphatase ENPP4-like isoform X2 n=1 Tax=Aphidius gifuensis TaxID=684658 RepID=UPI001CDBC4D0|nr:bis(5'-adenosyl)-triphosphatase ENPP4-like isoform X2 [Aphidius gifuensis]XP_044011175.1 bis(5'-adenosyl)-triphosphatase ENPP4-like isoform X2 [Aphidius gifuensis]
MLVMMLFQLLFLIINLKSVLLVPLNPKLLVISYDGFRYDYLNRNCTPFMKKIKEEGTYSDYMKNIFITKTFPNHHTIATGFYAETHGVIDSNYLTQDNKIMNMSQEMYAYNKNILPIWTLNELSGNGRHSGTMMWPGSIYKYNNTLPTHIGTFNISRSWKNRTDEIISWFLDPINPANFVLLYIEEPDFHTHALGTQSPKINELLKKLDNFTEYIFNKLRDNNLDDVNVVHLSDHGMADVPYSHIINISNIIDEKTEAKIVVTLSTAMIEPYNGKDIIVYNKLKNESAKTSGFEVYWKKDIPDKWHYRNNNRISKIFLIAKIGYAFDELFKSMKYYEKAFNITINNQSQFGVHGYDNGDHRMYPIFFARGPAFVSHCKLEPFNSVDLLSLFCHILNINCQQTNGTLNSFDKCLQIPPSTDESSYIYLGIMGVVIVTVIIFFVGYLYLQQRRRQVEIIYRRGGIEQPN